MGLRFMVDLAIPRSRAVWVLLGNFLYVIALYLQISSLWVSVEKEPGIVFMIKNDGYKEVTFTFLSTIYYAHCLLEYSKYILVPWFEIIILVVWPWLQLIIHVCSLFWIFRRSNTFCDVKNLALMKFNRWMFHVKSMYKWLKYHF